MYKAVVITLLVACSSFRAAPVNQTDQLVTKAAEGQLEAWLGKIEQGHEADYGFTNEDHMESCTVGKPFRMLSFNSDFYNNTLTDNTDYLTIRNEWRVPVLLKGQSRVLLTVDGNPGNLTVTGMGGAELARQLQVKSKGMNEGDSYYLLRIPQLPADFYVDEQDNSFNDAQFIPLPSAITAIPALSKGNKQAYTLTEVEQFVKEALTKKNGNKEAAKKKTTKKHN